VETKNAVIVRKHIGWGHLVPAHAGAHQPVLHRLPQPLRQLPPALGPGRNPDRPQGRKRRLYKQWRTPLETLLSLDRPQQYLRPGLSINALKRVAASISDTEAARRMQQAKNTLFEQIERTA
jgi:hypothetical protein